MHIVINAHKGTPPKKSIALSNGNHWLINYLLCTGYSSQNLPLGDFLAQYHQLSGNWIAVTPIHWDASHNCASIVASGWDLMLRAPESLSLFNDLASFYAEIGVKIFYHDAVTWLMNVDNLPPLQASYPHFLLNAPLMPALSTMDTTLYWQKNFTEIQMWLNTYPGNTNRSVQDTVNGLWFYGAGRWEPPKNPTFTDDKELCKRFPQLFQKLTGKKMKKDALLLLQNPEESISFANKHNVNWYWNDLAYRTPNAVWWKKWWKN